MSDAPQTSPAPAEPTLPPEWASAVRAAWGESDPVGSPETPASEQGEKVDPAKESEPAEKPASARLAELKRREAKAEAARKEQRATVAAHEAKVAELAQREARTKLLEEDPTKFFEGKSPAEVRSFLEKLAGEHKPEAVTERKLTTVEQELADLKKQLAERDESVRLRERTQQQVANEESAKAAFGSYVDENAEKYPHLVEEFTREEVGAVGLAALYEVLGTDSQGRKVTRIAAFIREHGQPPTEDQIADYLNGIAKARIEARQKSAWSKRGQNAPSASQALGDSNRAPTVTGTRPRTLSTRDTSSRASAPANRELTQEEKDDLSLQLLRGGIK